MQIKFNGKKDDLSAMLLSAERYALGRTTYMVQWTCEVLTDNLDLITLHDKKVMIRDIKQASFLGWDCDKKEWMQLLKILEERAKQEEKDVI